MSRPVDWSPAGSKIAVVEVEALRDLIANTVQEVVVAAGRRDPSQPRFGPTPAYLSCKAAAKLAGVSAKTVRRWIRMGATPVVYAGRLIRVSRSDLLEFLKGGYATKRSPCPEDVAKGILSKEIG